MDNWFVMSELKIGSIVTYFPNNQESKELPNGMTSAPAIVTQTFGEETPVHANITVFMANPTGEPLRQEWSVFNKKHPLYQGNEGVACFDY